MILSKIDSVPAHKISVKNGVAVRDTHLLSFNDEYLDHEAELLEAIRSYVNTGKDAIVIGGGSGASSVVTARQTGASGSVITYEGAKEYVDRIRETIRLNGVEDVVEVHHTIVGDAIHLQGDAGGAEKLRGADLPDCDILIMDCEGAERQILNDLEKLPELIVVETHTHFDASEEVIVDLLSSREFEILDRFERSKNISILVAQRTRASEK